MENHNHNHNDNAYIADDMSYDDLMTNAGWSAPHEQPFSLQQPHHHHHHHQQQQPGSEFYDHYDLSQSQLQPSAQPQQHKPQPSQYPHAPYLNSPYTSQYQQHARPLDLYASSTSFTEPALNSSTGYRGHDDAFSFGSSNLESATISPQSLQYSLPPSQTMNQTLSHATMSAATHDRQRNGTGTGTGTGTGSSIGINFNQKGQDTVPAAYYHAAQTGHFQPAQNSNSNNNNRNGNGNNNVRYPHLPHDTTTELRQIMKRAVHESPYPNLSQNPSPRPQLARPSPPPDPLRIIYPATDDDTKTRLPYAPFLAWDDEPIHVPSGLKTALPKYQPRKPRSGKDVVPGLDMSTTLKPAATSAKRGRPLQIRPVSQYRGTSNGPRPPAVNKLRDDGRLDARSLSPSTLTETSSSEEEDSSEESEYEDDEDVPLIDVATIRGAVRPTSVPEAARWDAIGIIWKDPNSSPSNDKVSEAIQEYGNFLSALRVQIKANSTKIEEAAARPAEVQRLKNERLVLLESLYQIVDAANKFGYGPIVENLGGHQKMVNGLTTTLIECTKVDDYKGRLPTAIFALLARFQNMSDDLLKKLRFDSIQKRWNKKGAEDTKQFIVDILAHTIDAKERTAKAKKDVEQVEKEKKMREKVVDQAKARTPEPNSSSTLSTKRPLDGDSSASKANKKFALDTTSTFNSSTKPTPIKRSGSNLLGIATKPIARALPKKREVSPPTESKLGALLASIAKPPEPPKAAIVPPRAPETPEEKARRERKESRRHLRVKFKDGPELEQIRLFKHEQAEDEGRQDEMLRDAHDDRLEGMMHKQRVSEVMDDDEEYQPTDADLPYPEPIAINFNPLDKSTRFGPTYTTRGGDLEVSTPEQKTQQRREGLELMVVYTDPSDIPPSAKEPPQMDTDMDAKATPELKPPTEPWLAERLKEIRQYGPEQATQNALMRQSEEQWRKKHLLVPATPSAGHMFSSPGSARQVSRTTAEDDTIVQQVLDHIQRLAASAKGLPYPATTPPRWMTNPAQRNEWIEGYNRDLAAKHQAEIEGNTAQLQASQSQVPIPSAQYQHTMPPPAAFAPQIQPPTHAGVPVPDVYQQAQGYQAAYPNGDNRAGPNPPFDYSNWANQIGQVQGLNYANQHQQPQHDQNWGEENRNQKNNHPQETQAGKSKRGYEMKTVSMYDDSLFDENGEYKGKKKPCRYYREGKCAKGSKCTYLHD